MHTKCVTLFVFAVLLAALLQGCEKQSFWANGPNSTLKKVVAEERAWEEQEQENQTCTAKEALENIAFSGRKWPIEQFDEEECVLKKFREDSGCKRIKVGIPDAEVPSDVVVLPYDEADSYVLTVEDNVLLECQSGILCLAADHVAWSHKIRGGVSRANEGPCPPNILEMPWFPYASSLIQHVEARSKKSKKLLHVQKAKSTQRVVTNSEGQQIKSNKTLKSSLPVYRIPRSKRAVDDAIVREMMKLNPEVFVSAAEEK